MVRDTLVWRSLEYSEKEVNIRKITVFHNMAMIHRGKGMTRDSRSPR